MSPLLVSITFWDCFTKTKQFFFSEAIIYGCTCMRLCVSFVNDNGIRMSALKIRCYLFFYSVTKRVCVMLYGSAFQLLVHGGSCGGAQSCLENYYFFHHSILKMLIALQKLF